MNSFSPVMVWLMGLSSVLPMAEAVSDPVDPSNRVEQMLVGGMNLTRNSLVNGVLVWTRRTEENEFIPGRSLQTSGWYKLVFDGDRSRAESIEDSVMEEGGGWRVISGTLLVETWDGSRSYIAPGDTETPRDMVILDTPKFRLHHHFLEFVFRSPGGVSSSMNATDFLPPPPDGVTRDIVIQKEDGRSFIVVTYCRDKDSTKAWFDMARGYYLVREEWVSQGRLIFEYRAEIDLVAGVWFPALIEKKTYGEDGRTSLLSRFEVDRDKTTFNVAESFGEEFFVISPVVGTEVTEHHQGKRRVYVVEKSQKR